VKPKRIVKTFHLCQYEKIASKCPYCGCTEIYRREMRSKKYDGIRIQFWLCSCKKCKKRFYPVRGDFSPAFYDFISHLRDVLLPKDIYKYCKWIGRKISLRKIRLVQPKGEVLRILKITVKRRKVVMVYLKKLKWA